MDGMVVHTQSKNARDAQKSVMEFLLINHPLDCPICDQGGECELQDVAVGYGQDVSQYAEAKRVVFDKNIGPLIATELTRCIHCTRCVRFGREIAGIRELGMTGRGENALISTFVDQCVNSEMSGNSVDVCPVGALTAKPSRYSARAWEMIQHKSVAPHDCIGSNIYLHTLRNEIVRVVPCENEAINEVWISDRDRFSYEGLDTPDRLTTPMIKDGDHWRTASWDEALGLVAKTLKSMAEDKAGQLEAAAAEADDADESAESEQATENVDIEISALVSASATLEEQYLAQKLMRALGSGNIDHRLRQSDFSDQDTAPVMPWLGMDIEQLETLNAALLVGSNVRKEQPIANLRLRKAAVNHDAKIAFLNPRYYEFNFPVAQNLVVAQQSMVDELAAIAAAVYQLTGNTPPAAIAGIAAAATVSDQHKTIAQQLNDAENAGVILGNIAQMHPQFSAMRTLCAAIASETGSRFGYLTDGCNAAGAWLAGAVPHRGPGGRTEDVVAGDALPDMLAKKQAACLLVNVEPDTDAANAHALMTVLADAEFVVSISSYNSASLKKVANVMLPAASFAETSGTYVNAEGFWQSFKGAIPPAGEARPAWKILRVLGNLAGAEGFDFMSSEEVRDEVRAHCENIELSNDVNNAAKVVAPKSAQLTRASDVPMYAADAVVRRSAPLQQTVDAQKLCVRMNAEQAERLGVAAAGSVRVRQGDNSAVLDLVIDDSVPAASVWIPLAVEGNDQLGEAFAEVTIESNV
jgi:NADH-quinone oxidoreductase subunit G